MLSQSFFLYRDSLWFTTYNVELPLLCPSLSKGHIGKTKIQSLSSSVQILFLAQLLTWGRDQRKKNRDGGHLFLCPYLYFTFSTLLITKRIFWIKKNKKYVVDMCDQSAATLSRWRQSSGSPGPSHLTPHLYWNLNDTICALPPRTFVFTFAIWICWLGLRE